MKNMKKCMAVMAAASLVAATGITASAYEYNGNMGELGTLSDDAKEYGHTTFSIIESEQDPTNVSFTVPLFVTMAAVNGETELKVPTNYGIKNTSTESSNGADDAFDIAVVGMDFTKLEGATYSTVASGGTAKSVALTLGNMLMPTIKEDTSVFEVTKPVDIIGQNSDFYNTTSEKLKLIEVGSTFDIAIKGTLGAAPSISGSTVAVPQFKVKYVVSGVTEDGEVIGAVYAGDDKVAAGLAALEAE